MSTNTNREIAEALRKQFVTVEQCRMCDNTGDVPGPYMGTPGHPCYHCGRGLPLARVLRELEES